MRDPSPIESEPEDMEDISEEEVELEEGEVEREADRRDSETEAGEAEAGARGDPLPAVAETPLGRAPKKARSIVLPRTRQVIFHIA